MDPITMMLLVSTGLKVFGSLSKGSAEAKAHRANAAAAQAAKIATEQKAAVDVDTATRDYRLATARNQNSIGKSGVSAQSFYDVLADDAAQSNLEVQKIYFNADSRRTQLDFTISGENAAARDAKRSGIIGAISAGISGGMSAYQPGGSSAAGASPGLSFDQPFMIK